MSNEASIGKVFRALANQTRRTICDELKLRPMTTKQICACFSELDRCTVMQHVKVLEDAGLIIAVRKGRERFNYLDAMPIETIHQRWIGPHAAAASAGLSRLKADLESSVKQNLTAG